MIKALEISSPDLKRTVSFYSDLFNLVPAESAPGTVSFTIGTSQLVFRQVDGTKPYCHFAIDIPHNKLLEAYNHVSKKVSVLNAGNTTPFASFIKWNAQSFYFLDNNNNLVELICRYDLPNSSTEVFSRASLLNISEIGIATIDVKALLKELNDKYGLPVYAKQPPLDDFAAAGDDTGLLILAKTGRNWFPSDLPARQFYTKISLEGGDRQKAISVEFNAH